MVSKVIHVREDTGAICFTDQIAISIPEIEQARPEIDLIDYQTGKLLKRLAHAVSNAKLCEKQGCSNQALPNHNCCRMHTSTPE